MKRGLKIYSVDFTPMYPVGGGLIVAAHHEAEALSIAKGVLTFDCGEITLKEIDVSEAMVIYYASGDY